MRGKMTPIRKRWLIAAMIAALLVCALLFHFTRDRSYTEVTIEGVEAHRQFESALRRHGIRFEIAPNGKFFIHEEIDTGSDPRLLDYRVWRARATGVTTPVTK